MNSTTVGKTSRLTIGMTHLSAAAAMCASLLLLPACGKVQGQFLILQDQVLDATCAPTADVGTIYQGTGILDVSLVGMNGGRGYFVFPLMENNFPAPINQQTDPNRIALSGFEVQLSLLTDATAASIAPTLEGSSMMFFQMPWSGTVKSGGGLSAGVVEAFPKDLALAVFGKLGGGDSFEVDATVRALGTQISGNIVSDDFHFPIKVCNRCLVTSAPPCPASSAPVNTGNRCNFSQDGLVDCCTTSAGLVCPATTRSP
jgi:hypothetical protein